LRRLRVEIEWESAPSGRSQAVRFGAIADTTGAVAGRAIRPAASIRGMVDHDEEEGSERDDSLGFETRAIRSGAEPTVGTNGAGDIVSPIHLASTFAADRLENPTAGYSYSRLGNPTRDALEDRLAALEGADHGLAFASGTAAITCFCLATVEPGDHVLAFDSLYGGTRVLFDDLLSKFGIDIEYVDATDPEIVADAMTPETALLWMETPTNPLLKLCDIEALACLAEESDTLLAVDNTFASPSFQQPLALGADAVVYSTTKFLNGHSDSVGGAVLTNDDALAEGAEFVQEYGVGAMLAPFDCYLTLRGIKTLPVRMAQHENNAQRIAAHLQDESRVERVNYPGLESHPQHDLAARQMDGFGGVVSFEIDGGTEEARTLLGELELFSVAVSLGSVESLIEHPVSMSASYVPDAERRAAGITDSLLRIPVGIEDSEDLIADLKRGFEAL
jgi:cystathionine gamma-lyase